MAGAAAVTDAVQAFVQTTGPVLSLDIGSGTQDALLALPGERPENWPQFVLPAPARIIAGRIREQTRLGRPVWLYGRNMGGGFAGAIQEQREAGLSPAAAPAASASLHDKPERVAALGVALAEQCPPGHVPIGLGDYDAGFWNGLLSLAHLPAPALVVAAAQDHGRHPDAGNREGRFRLWRELLRVSEGDPGRWIFTVPPAPYTRLQALQEATGGPVTDTGAAAVLGALAVPDVLRRSRRQGVTVVNVGNSHVLAFLLYRERILGVYEQHTGLLDTEALLADLREFRFGWLPDEQVRARGGHGCAFVSPLPAEAEGFAPTFVIGPRRELLQGHGQFVAPYGDMMIAGCHGLLLGLARQATQSAGR